MTTPPNLHACAVVLGRTGLLVTGASGSGKTELCLGLIAACRAEGVFARLVSDDQVFLSIRSGRLVVNAPQTIAGLVELRGFAPAPVATLPAMVADRMVRMVPAAPRFAEPATEVLHGIALPRLDVASDAGAKGVRAVLGWLGLPPFTA
ncbi:MAG: HPr kinase/phosphorylase [Rhizobiaceae bacterium]|nr:HPr kinase/phosphorylase [Rhizobiaceae bacterium]